VVAVLVDVDVDVDVELDEGEDEEIAELCRDALHPATMTSSDAVTHLVRFMRLRHRIRRRGSTRPDCPVSMGARWPVVGPPP
jgi:hypothetical protein